MPAKIPFARQFLRRRRNQSETRERRAAEEAARQICKKQSGQIRRTRRRRDSNRHWNPYFNRRITWRIENFKKFRKRY